MPLAEFTPERNALAKRLGAAGASIRALEKPNLPAWAVNQLFWRKRAVFDRLMAASGVRRSAHAKRLGGKDSDIAAAESAYALARRAALDEIRGLLAENGAEASPATLHAVTETLEALPGPAPPGRLTKPLQPAGFEALAGLVSTSARTLRGLTPPAPAPAPKPRVSDEPPDPRTAKREDGARKRADADRKKAREAIEKDLREARAAARKAESALTAARGALARAKEERQRLQDQLLFVVKKIDDAASEVRTCEERVAQAGQEQRHLEAKLETH